VRAAQYSPAITVGPFSIRRPDDDRKCPCGQQWSELQRDDRIAAECASHPLPRNKFSLLPWQAVAAMAALLHSSPDHQRMLMRRMQGRRSLLQIGPTSRTRDSAWFLFPCQDFGPVANLSKSYPRPASYFWTSPLPPASARNASVRPQKVFETNIVQARFCFFATAAAGRHELVIDRDSRFPLRIFLQQSRCVESGLVIPE
jgi:hypothetical protein